jgi:hypothetical protein
MPHTNTQIMEDPYYWRNKVMSWRAQNEVDNSDSKNSSNLTWKEVVAKESFKDDSQNQSALNKLWYKEGMQIDPNSKTVMADSLQEVMRHLKNIVDQAKKSGHDILQGIIDDPTLVMEDPEQLKLRALAVSALAEADGHAPDAKKILDQAGSEKSRKLKNDSKKLTAPVSVQNRSK